MAKDDYGTATVGGGLKFKGVKGGGVEKKKKKMKKHAKHDDKVEEALMKTREQTKASSEDAEEGNVHKDDQLKLAIAEETSGPSTSRKTEAEKKHEELRRKRLDDKLKREGVKSHKERVEEFNKHLSNLSEHHDMPRIGPG